jgi:DNA-binding NtrC family response regulator
MFGLAGEPFKRLRVLILDDDEDVALSIRDVIALRSHSVSVVHDLESAWREISVCAPNVFLTDYRIGVLNSGPLLATLGVSFPGIRLVLVTGSRRKEWSHLVAGGLVHATLTKPFDADELVVVVEADWGRR